ncbi:transposase [Metallumcola ferriviriculae]|uniref:Transposase n=1 Tax=Metallumcola ferriviriculae TaxID=3039180 RepID=A0AAU0ULI1_9FIRM|nr:transposase [Desulfitibacteraceae bacterium MK1]
MGREARKRSSTGIYHIMLRGIDKRDIFLDDEDKIRFMEKLMKAKETGKFELYGYCLMDNHVHLLIKENEDIGASIKRITVGYVWWHNNKYGRTGHLFQNRYKSEPVETESYLLTVLRYIHQNPVKAKIVLQAKDYSWSSYKQYLLSYQQQNGCIDDHLIKAYFKTIADFCQYMNDQNNDECLDYI